MKSETTNTSIAKKPEVIRLNLVISPELNDLLQHLADTSHSTKAQLLRKAIALFDIAVDAKDKNKRLGIFNAENQIECEIIGI
jgi:hypothetical protein